MQRIGTGFEAIDAALGGLITGDNVVWICDDAPLFRTAAAAFVESAAGRGRRCLYVDFGSGVLHEGPRVDRIDAGAGSSFGRAGVLADELERRVRDDPPACLVVDRLSLVSRRWRTDDLSRFFARVCPAMLQAGVTAYWHIDGSLGRAFIDDVRQITQCLLDVRSGRLRVLKAEGRPDALQGISYQLRVDDGELVASSPPARGRLARGLVAVREQLGISQQELAAVARVTPSAISQAEAGTRGLSLDTVVTIAEGLQIPVDRLLGTPMTRSYRLARHDRSRQLPDGRTIALESDSTVGIRAYLIELAGGESGEPPFEHHGVATIAPLRGLMQVDLDDDRPVLRAGDMLILETGSVRAWRNLRRDPASWFWILRD